MSAEEIREFLDGGRTAMVATIGPDGRPHLVPMWYVLRGDAVAPILAMWTYGTSQKAANLRRLPQATVLVEAGESYGKLRGVSMECDVEVVTDREKITKIGFELNTRYIPNRQVATAASQYTRLQAAKRVGMICTPTKIVSWDHRKL